MIKAAKVKSNRSHYLIKRHIDIYIQTNKKENILKSKIVFLREFEKEFGEQKVDLIIDNGSIQKEIFKIAKQGIKL